MPIQLFGILRNKLFSLFTPLAPEMCLMDLAKQLEMGNGVLELDTTMSFALTYKVYVLILAFLYYGFRRFF